jgi:hypothetical protein
MEKSVMHMRKKIESKHVEGKATAARLREENLELLETVIQRGTKQESNFQALHSSYVTFPINL